MVAKKEKSSPRMSSEKPVIIWYSDPVGPDETVVLNGYGFSEKSKARLSRLSDETDCKTGKVVEIIPLVATCETLKFVVPDSWKQGVYACSVETDGVASETVLVNKPDIWWKQGDGGVNVANQGGWLRLQGKCLAFDMKPKVRLVSGDKTIDLSVVDYSNYMVKAEIPKNLRPGDYQIQFNNGHGGDKATVIFEKISVNAIETKKPMVMNVVECGADPGGKKDSTCAIVCAIERLGAFGGGVVYFPAGRYRIDSILRSGYFVQTSLKIPENIMLRGESMELVSLWWPDQHPPLPTLIEGGNDFTIEELTIYTQGKHSTLITGQSNVTINRVRIRANCYYMTNCNGQRHHGREVNVNFRDTSLGSAFVIWGNNLKITNCDIYTSNICFDIRHCHGGVISNNTVMAKNFFFLSGCGEFILEKNKFVGNQLTTGGSNFALHFGARVCKHTYLAHNDISHIYGGDHEAFTLDGHGNVYLGGVKSVQGDKLVLSEDWLPKIQDRAYMPDSYGTAVYIIEGKGRGQYRWLKDYEGRNVTLDEPWLVEPDDTSILSIGAFNGRHLIIGNTMSDTGTAVQLYPPNNECIVAENKTYRASNMNCLSRLRKDRVNGSRWMELSWYNQFLDNEIVEGNCWGGGCTEVDRWLGGETCLNIWGMQFDYYTDEYGAGQGGFITKDGVKEFLREKTVRENSIPFSMFTIIRRHKIHNNSSIRIRSRVTETLIEGCEIRRSAHGIRVDSEIAFDMPEDLGQTFDFDPEDQSKVEALRHLTPDHVLMRNNKFENVGKEYCGNAIDLETIKRIE